MFYDNYVRFCNSVDKTPSAVAIEIGLSKPTVNRWKKGGGVTDATAIKIADYFGVSVAELTAEQKEKPVTENGNRQSEIDFIFSQLSSSRQAKLLELARLYLDDQRKSEETQ